MGKWRDAITNPPKKYGEYIICRLDQEVTTAIYHPENKPEFGETMWQSSEEFFYIEDVIAWMPLPKPVSVENIPYAIWQESRKEIKTESFDSYYYSYILEGYKCSSCGYLIQQTNPIPFPSVCPQCGKLMINSRGSEEDE